MKHILVGLVAMAASSAALAQTAQAPTAPPNSSMPTGATTLGSPGDSGAGTGSMDTQSQTMASDPATTDKGMTKPQSKHRSTRPRTHGSAMPR